MSVDVEIILSEAVQTIRLARPQKKNALTGAMYAALAEALTERYGEQVDFVGWIADLELDALVTMTVGELVTFVAASIDGPAES